MKIAQLLDTVPPRLAAIGEAEASLRPAPGRWSKKEILGHLIDSASNNHQRFVRALFTPRLDFPSYEQTRWVAAQSYQTEPWPHLIALWTALNHHLAHIIQSIPNDALSHECSIGGAAPITLESVIEGYIGHLEHHLAQIFSA